ncbi:MAG: EF-P lysine aminoacylase GenX [Kiritimatiellae bacterium]|nr:EF-P lysine aminoacylase GenX [Kiritimatiellia bacterium]
MHATVQHLAACRPRLEIRSRALQAIRGFFIERGFLEVETPVRLRTPAMELHIDAEPAGSGFLRTSPELHMKRLLAAGYPRIFQVGPCFRRGEFGRIHNPEYTMLEWYRAGADYSDMLVDAKALVAFTVRTVLGDTRLTYQGTPIETEPIWERFTVAEAFIRFAGWDPTAEFDPDRFDADLVEKVEPGLPRHCPVILADYPAARAALARRKPGDERVAERWELYAGGMELANAFTELVDPVEQRARFDACAAERGALGMDVYPLDEAFLAALENGMPPSGGVALGLDRLVMLLADCRSLDEVLPFRGEACTGTAPNAPRREDEP